MEKFTKLLLLTIFLITSCTPSKKKQESETRYSIYFNGDIITMEGDTPIYVEALVVKNDKILFVGSKEEAVSISGKNAENIDLQGNVLIPSFIDAHSHFTRYADLVDFADLNPPPVGEVTSIPDIIEKLTSIKELNNIQDGEWLLGNGYDQDFLKEKRHPTADDLDMHFPNNPVVIMHTSGHMLVANSVAFKIMGIDENTKDPLGGNYLRKKGTNIPKGLVLENARVPFLKVMLPKRTMEQQLDKLMLAQEYYASNGVTTAQEGMTFMDKLLILDAAAKQKKLYIDIVSLIAYDIAKEMVVADSLPWDKYVNRLKYAGIKISLDGSPQGKTAYLSKAYNTKVPGCDHDCKGFPRMTQDDINGFFELCYKNSIQLHAHCNGDATVDMMLKGHEFAIKKLGIPGTNKRTVIVHSQIMRPDQLGKYKEYGLLPSFFTNHTFFWGDIHENNLGEERASFISPMKSAMNMGIKCTNHSDYMVTPMDPLFLIWTSVNRITRSGKILGPDERITPYQAIQAITINAAYEYFEEDSKGTLSAGKLADMVILNSNPLKVDPMTIKDIVLLETIKEGTTIYKK